MKIKSKGRLEVICGSMFSGKTEELIRRVRRAEFAKIDTIVFKHRFDSRVSIEYVNAHSGDKFRALAVDSAEFISEFITDKVQVVAIDEIQFFPNFIVDFVLDLVKSGKRVIVAGLDLDFRGIPFGCMPALMAIADCVTKLNAVCMECGCDARFTQRLVNGKAANFDDPIIMIGAQESYQARCRDCYVIDKSVEYGQK